MDFTRFPDGYTVLTSDTGWTDKNRALKAQGHDVGVNDYDVIIHFADCSKCRDEAMKAYWDREHETYLNEQEYRRSYGEFEELPFE